MGEMPSPDPDTREKGAPAPESNNSDGDRLEELAKTGPIHCLTIIGQVEGHMILPPQNKTTKYEHVIPLLVSLEQSTQVEGLLVLLNTMGGDVEAGLAIAEMIAGMTKPTVSVVLGGGHSIGIPLAVCTDYSFITPTATMTVHPIRMNGLIIGASQTYDYFNRMQERVVSFISQHSSVSREELSKLMLTTGELVNDIGTILVGEAAVQCGLIDAVGSLRQALGKLQELIDASRRKAEDCTPA